MAYKTKYEVGDVIPINFTVTDIDNDDGISNWNYELSVKKRNGITIESFWFTLEAIEQGKVLNSEERKLEIINQISELNKELQELSQ